MSDTLKQQVGTAALDHVHSGMKLGIGTGSTADAFIRALAGDVARGLDIIGVPTSERTAALCGELNIPLTTLEEAVELDLTIDGADEIDPALNLIKGAGGALLREKIVATASKKMLVIADDSKIVSSLGAFPLPIEVNEFGLASTKSLIETVAKNTGLSCSIALRTTADNEPYLTDGGHLILDASFGLIADPVKLSEHLIAIPGVVETGLFTGLATYAHNFQRRWRTNNNAGVDFGRHVTTNGPEPNDNRVSELQFLWFHQLRKNGLLLQLYAA